MYITRQHKSIVRETFSVIAKDADIFADAFYSSLFAIDPALWALFKGDGNGDLREQGRKLVIMLSITAASLDRLNALVPQIEALGMRHLKNGVKLEHYATVGQALLIAVETMLGDAYTPAVHEAWLTLYTVLADTATAKAYPTPLFSDEAEATQPRRQPHLYPHPRRSPLPSPDVLRATFSVI